MYQRHGKDVVFLFNKEVAGSIPPPFPWAKESNRNSYLKLRQDRRNFRWFNGYVIRSIPVTNGIDDGLDENFLWQPRHGKFWLLTRGWDDEDPKDQAKASDYKSQGRGGRGSRGSKTRDEDFLEHLFTGTTHNYLLLFTEQGRCFWLRVYEIPEASKTSQGRNIQNIISIPPDDNVKAYIVLKDLTDTDFQNSHYITFCTKKGIIKKTSVEAFSRPRTNGINAITIKEGDQLIDAKLTNGNSHIFLANMTGRAIRFDESRVRPMGRSAAGVRGIKLDDEGDQVVGMVSVDPNDKSKSIMVVSAKGNGKRTEIDEYRITNRGGKGVKTMQISDKTGKVVAIKAVDGDNDVMITTKDGIIIRMSLDNIRIMGRATQGVRVIRLGDGEEIADVAVLAKEEVSDEEE